MGTPQGPEDAAAGHRRRLALALGMATAVLVAEVAGAVVAGSLALAADAGHMFTDVVALALALAALTVSRREASSRSTFGLYRLEIFAAALNAVILLGVAAWVSWAAVGRLQHPPAVEAPVMLGVGLLGLIANSVSLRWLQPAQGESLNVRGAYLEVLGDLLGSAGVVVAAIVILTTGYLVADPAISLLVALLIVPRTWLLLREAVNILLESTPRGLDLAFVRAHIGAVEGVVGVHDLHVWTITSGRPVMSAHVVLSDEWLARSGETLDQLQQCLAEHFDVEHCTFQLEPVGHRAHEEPTHR